MRVWKQASCYAQIFPAYPIKFQQVGSTDFHQASAINSENNNFQLYSASSERDPCARTAFVSKEHSQRMGSGHGKRKRQWNHQWPDKELLIRAVLTNKSKCFQKQQFFKEEELNTTCKALKTQTLESHLSP